MSFRGPLEPMKLMSSHRRTCADDVLDAVATSATKRPFITFVTAYEHQKDLGNLSQALDGRIVEQGTW